jgi:hypothetical protein
MNLIEMSNRIAQEFCPVYDKKMPNCGFCSVSQSGCKDTKSRLEDAIRYGVEAWLNEHEENGYAGLLRFIVEVCEEEK